LGPNHIEAVNLFKLVEAAEIKMGEDSIPKNSHVFECRMHPREFPFWLAEFCVRWFSPAGFFPRFSLHFPTRGNVNGVICPAALGRKAALEGLKCIYLNFTLWSRHRVWSRAALAYIYNALLFMEI